MPHFIPGRFSRLRTSSRLAFTAGASTRVVQTRSLPHAIPDRRQLPASAAFKQSATVRPAT